MQTSKIQGQKLRPILFTTDMVRAILEGRKTQTRRIKFTCEVGDVLWVRETFFETINPDKKKKEVIYKADLPDDINKGWGKLKYKFTPNIFMPREACRLFLQVEAVREERLQYISENEAEKEGVNSVGIFTDYGSNENVCVGESFKEPFAELWDSINAKRGYGWDSNPIVKVIEFRVLEDFCGEDNLCG